KLVRQLTGLPASDLDGREQIMDRLDQIQDKIIDADLNIHDHQAQIAEANSEVNSLKKDVDGLQSSIGTVSTGISSLADVNISSQMKSAAEAEDSYQKLRAEFQQWSLELGL